MTTPTKKPTETELRHRFFYHQPNAFALACHKKIQEQAFEFALDLVAVCPAGRALSVALTKLEECRMWANAAVAHRDDAIDG